MKIGMPFAFVFAFAVFASAQHDPAPSGFEPLFNGTDLSGWEGNPEFFRVEDGAIVAGRLTGSIPRNEFLCTERRYANFELRLKVRGSHENVNGGVQVRSERIPDSNEVRGYQVDIGTIGAGIARRLMDDPAAAADAHLPERGMASLWGALYDESRRNKLLTVPDQSLLAGVVKSDDWNDFVIRCEGPRIQVWVNGVQTTDYTEAETGIPSEGIVGLQIHSGAAAEIRYRDIIIQQL